MTEPGPKRAVALPWTTSAGPAGRLPAAGKLRSLNRPRPVRVATTRGTEVPKSIEINDRQQRVEDVVERWRIDDEWWREPVSRLYFSLVLEDGAYVTVYRDLTQNRWYLQHA